MEKKGVIDALTKVLVGLYEAPEKPASAIDFIRTYLSFENNDVDLDKLQGQVEELKKKLADQEKAHAEEVEALKKEIEAFKAGGDGH